MSEFGFGNQPDFDLKIASFGPLLVWFLVEIWYDKSLILRFLGLIFCLTALECLLLTPTKPHTEVAGDSTFTAG